MTSTWRQQANAERAARSAFKEAGQPVAIVSHHWERRIVGKAIIAKVYANGNFTLIGNDGKPGPQQWRPDYDGKAASRTGGSTFSRSDHLEPWTAAIERELLAAKLARRLQRRRDAAVDELNKLPLTVELISAIEAAVAAARRKGEED